MKIRETTVQEKHWGPDDDYLVVPEIQVMASDGFWKGQKVRVTIEPLEVRDSITGAVKSV